jgi:hypothetical protein
MWTVHNQYDSRGVEIGVAHAARLGLDRNLAWAGGRYCPFA